MYLCQMYANFLGPVRSGNYPPIHDWEIQLCREKAINAGLSGSGVHECVEPSDSW
jgi:hypothetical protein